MDYFKNANFDFGWEIPFAIDLFGNTYVIMVVADAYSETELTNKEQNASFTYLVENYKRIFSEVEQILIKEAQTKDNVAKRFTPEFFNIKRDGEMGLVINDNENEENGFVIIINSDYKIISTDQFF